MRPEAHRRDGLTAAANREARPAHSAVAAVAAPTERMGTPCSRELPSAPLLSARYTANVPSESAAAKERSRTFEGGTPEAGLAQDPCQTRARPPLTQPPSHPPIVKLLSAPSHLAKARGLRPESRVRDSTAQATRHGEALPMLRTQGNQERRREERTPSDRKTRIANPSALRTPRYSQTNV